MTKPEIYSWIKKEIPKFKEWYQPVDFGEGVIAHVTKPEKTSWGLKWRAHPELLNDNARGLAKWNYIIRKHIPDIKGKKVMDIGCSSGVFCIEMARMGAIVTGIDRDENIKHKSTDVPPSQNVIAQAKFVKHAFNLLDNTVYKVDYYAKDIGTMGFKEFGRQDLVLALNVVYHELNDMQTIVDKLANITDHLILQTSLGHTGLLGKCASLENHKMVLQKAGFKNIEIDAPKDYDSPLIIAKK